MRKFRRILFDFIKMLIRSRPLFPIVCVGVFLSLSPISRIGNKEYNIVVLDRERFWPGDLERLAEKNNLWEMSSRVRGFLHSLFFVGGELGILRTGATTPEFDYKVESFKKYIGRVFMWLSSRRRIDFVMTCGYLYVQNRLIARALSNTNIRFIDLHRETKQDSRIYENFKKKYLVQRADMSFEGNALLVDNEGTKRLYTDINTSASSLIHVVGSPRIDLLIRKIRSSENIPVHQCSQVTVFSFREMPIGENEQAYPQGFTKHRDRGFVRLFDSVHGQIARLAKRNPEIRFLIKTKWDGVWHDRIYEALNAAVVDAGSLPNIEVKSIEVDAIDEILRSRAVVGLNSMTMVQARLAGRVVIQPTYFEITEEYSSYLQYSSIQEEFIVSRSEEEFGQNLQEAIEHPAIRLPLQGVFDEYVGPTDGKNLDRVQYVLRNLAARGG